MKTGISPMLQRILADTARETECERARHSQKRLKQMVKDAPPLMSFRAALTGGEAMIAEIKQKSPSQGPMRVGNFEAAQAEYKRSRQVKAISVLTNLTHFGAGMKMSFLRKVKENTGKPVLRKDFITEEYQVWQARAFGADAILLMANLLDRDQLLRLSDLASELGMDVLFETHCPAELDDLPAGAAIVGINCRNFDARRFSFSSFQIARLFRIAGVKRDQSVNLKRFDYAHQLPSSVIKVAESGVTPKNCRTVFELGFHAVLVGTSLLLDARGIRAALGEFEAVIEEVRKSRRPAKLQALRPVTT